MLEDNVAASPSNGMVNYTQFADPVWRIDFTTVPLRESEFPIIDAWWKSLRGGLKAALVTQNVTCRPLAHAATADAAPAQDTGVLDSITNGNVLAVSSVDAGLVLAPGDLIGLEKTGKRSLGRITEVSGTGTSRTITIEPPPRSYTDAGSAVRFEKPMLVMRPIPKSWNVTDGPLPVVSFSLVETPA
ncbi:hypothetical protein [Mesorhizobium sp. Root157]|uniref:hypothetical protein n=1 Tax=Mesorhizobium sp. Root157 TaxID=1736477 RepID=UPI001FCCDF7A|nr:hypothetical protein [Mesorhizobium sp. Root157]